MQFPDCDAMTPDERIKNSAAQEDLTPGKYYRFDPPATATGIPTGGPNVCPLQVCEFDRGWYMGFKEEKHIFQGKPINDLRKIGEDMDVEDEDLLRQCYFFVLFIGGNKVILDENQDHD